MAKWIVAGLAALNLLLGLAVWSRVAGDKPAFGQIGGVQSDYAAVAGFTNNTTTIFLLQVSTGHLAAVQIDPVGRTSKPIAVRNVADDLAHLTPQPAPVRPGY
ncbi:MAG TPA: hypothetical protein VHQ47_04955 [Phycisphaerae bacterium]|nr:hypothetical protein [Phycisphaerae bacterium]